jgi:hypothetical protein
VERDFCGPRQRVARARSRRSVSRNRERGERALSIPIPQTTCDERLRIRVICGGPDALDAAIALMERRDPSSLEQALGLVPNSGELSPRCREVMAEAWDRYFHMKSMPWD